MHAAMDNVYFLFYPNEKLHKIPQSQRNSFFLPFCSVIAFVETNKAFKKYGYITKSMLNKVSSILYSLTHNIIIINQVNNNKQ